MPRRAAITLGIGLACCQCAAALDPSLDINQYAHTAWTIRDGFFKGVITSIAQTPDGYLWLGTEFGLVRFDGVRAVPWQPPTGERALSGYIVGVLAARDGRLWIGTSEGLASWKDGKLTHYPELAGQFVGAPLEDRDGTVWAGGISVSASAARLCAIRSGGVKCFGGDGRFGNSVYPLYEDSRGNLWAGARGGLWRLRPGPQRLYLMPDPAIPINSLIEGDNGALLIATHGGIRQLVNGKAEAYPLPGTGREFNPSRLLRDRNGGLWIGTAEQGLMHVRKGRVDLSTRSDGLSADFVRAVFEDREGNIWVATSNGLDRFREFAVPTISVKQGLSNDAARSVLAARDGSVWFGTLDGLNRLKDRQITIYRKRSSGLPDDFVKSLFQDDQGRILVFTLRGAAWFEDGRFTPVDDLPGKGVSSVAEDSAGSLWVSDQDRGLLHLLRGSVVERIPWAKMGRSDFAYSLLPDLLQGGLWLGFYQGSVAYFKDGQVRASYASADGLGEGRVDDLQLDRDGTLWAATQGGLSRLKNSRVATLTSKNGLPCDGVQWMMEDDAHSVWLYMVCGLVRVARSELDAWAANPKRTIQTTVFDIFDGVRSHSINSGYNPRVAKTADGKLWFLGGDGVSVIDPRRLPFNKLPPPVHIEQITADRQTYDASSNLRLPPLVRDLEIDYTALSLVAPEKIRFKVKLEGRDPGWKDVGNERKAFYNDLPPRKYRFRVMACNNSGVWNEAGASFNFSIDPRYYQTSWFQALCVIAFLALLWGIYRYRLHQVARQFDIRLEERIGERNRMARDLHDTLLQGFQGLMLRLQAVDNLLPEGEGKKELERTLDRGDDVLAESRKAVHDLRSSTTVTNELAQAVRAVGEELASEESARFRLTVEGRSREMHPIVRDEIYRIAREALRNAFVHARAQRIEVEITYEERLLRLRIRDDGGGIPAEILEVGRSGHFGLAGMRERARQIGATLDIWSGAGTGTEIDLSVPGSIAYRKQLGRSRWRVFGRKAG